MDLSTMKTNSLILVFLLKTAFDMQTTIVTSTIEFFTPIVWHKILNNDMHHIIDALF